MTMASEERHRLHDEASGDRRIDFPKAAIADSSVDVASHPLEEPSTDPLEKESTELGHVECRSFKDVRSLSGFLGPQIQLSHNGFEFLPGV
jgi:hypothetical protein